MQLSQRLIKVKWYPNSKTCLEYLDLNYYHFLIPQKIYIDQKRTKVKYKLHYGQCRGRFLGLPHGTKASCSDTNKNLKSKKPNF